MRIVLAISLVTHVALSVSLECAHSSSLPAHSSKTKIDFTPSNTIDLRVSADSDHVNTWASAIAAAVAGAESLGCHVRLPPTVPFLPLFVSTCSTLIHPSPSKKCSEWRLPAASPNFLSLSARQSLRMYFGSNDTHALGMPCNINAHIAIHLEGGSSVKGSFHPKTEQWISFLSRNVSSSSGHISSSPGYFPSPYPVAFYSDQLWKVSPSTQIDILIDSDGGQQHPAYYFLEHLSSYRNVRMYRSMSPARTLSHLSCASTVVASQGPLKLLYHLRPQQVLVEYVEDPSMQGYTPEVVGAYIESAKDRARMGRVRSSWKNSFQQRYMVGQACIMAQV